jgi:uncharacterized protein (DUF1330 family)
MPAYMIVQIKITREDGWPEYREQVSRLFAAHGGRYLVRGGQVEVLEGSHDGRRLVVFEFPSMEVIRSSGTRPNTRGSRSCGRARGSWTCGRCRAFPDSEG